VVPIDEDRSSDLVPPDVAEVLDGGPLPKCPRALEADEEVAVAVWREQDFAAVMTIWRDPEGDEAADSPDDDSWPYNVDVTQYRRTAGRWRWAGGGGSDWPVSYGERPADGRPALTGFAFGSDDGMWWTGLAPLGVERVRAVMGESVQGVAVEPVTGAFMVAFPCPGPSPAGVTSA
jgi:hypothetical protein